MPAGLPYFAWIDAGETTFGSEHMRWDESVFSFELKQEEGDPASLTAVVRRPRNEAGNLIGLLGPGRKIWAWFALDCGPALVKFRGRLVGIPTSIFEDLVTLEFVAKPIDVVAQKEALANTLRVLPYYDETMIEETKRDDPDVVLEGYTKIWHYDRETHIVTVSDEISGEDGLVEFDGASDTGKIFYDGLGLTLTGGPLSRIDVQAEFTWTQQARGTVDLTQYLISHWPTPAIYMEASNWPKNGTGIGDGWTVADATAINQRNTEVTTETQGGEYTVIFGEGDSTKTTWSLTRGAIDSVDMHVGHVVTADTYKDAHSTDPDGGDYVSSISASKSYTDLGIVVQSIVPTLVAEYTCERECTELVSFTLFADVQPILTDPEDGEALRLDDIRSVNLSEPIGEELPIGDPRRRSYIATERGNRSLEYLIALARTHLMKRARVVQITFAPKLSRMPEITLRKNVFLAEPRVGEALGKIIGYSIALDGSDGRINCEISIGCTIGRGGIVTATDGLPAYCSIDYVGFDYQRFVDRTVLIDAFIDSSVGYQPPDANPNDDGIDFLSTLTADDVIEVGLVVERGPETIEPPPPFSNSGHAMGDSPSDAISAVSEDISTHLIPQFETRATFKLKSMTRKFSSDYELQVTDLMIPLGIDLEAA